MHIPQVLSHTFKAVGALFIAGTLAGCVDVTMELEVLDESNGIGRTSIVMDRQFYDMAQQQGGDDFCDEDNGVLTLSDSASTCIVTINGGFDELFEANDDGSPVPTAVSAGPGLVRVAYPTGSMSDEFADTEDDPSSKAMLEQFFEGHTIILKVSGAQIVESNMEISADGKSASFTIPFLGLINGDFELPTETYAIVKVN